MHAVFIPYGHKRWVDLLLRDMEAQKFDLPMLSPDGKQTKLARVEGQIRVLPFGVYEYVFPKEVMDAVLTTLDFQVKEEHYILKQIKGIPFKPIKILRKLLNLKEIPEFKTDKMYPWLKKDYSGNQVVAIIPLGIREDADYIETKGDFKDWKHEGL